MIRVEPTDKPVFVFSSGRSGTLFLSKLIDISEEIVSRHEAYASLIIDCYTKCSYRSSCPRVKCHLQGTDEDEYITNQILGIMNCDILAHAKADLRIGESNSHLFFMAAEVASIYPNSHFVVSYRDPFECLASVIARNKWHSWFGEFDGRCRYALGTRDSLSSRRLSFEERWLIHWCDVWSSIIEGCQKKRFVNVHAIRINNMDVSAGEELLHSCELSYNRKLLHTRYDWFDRHSSYHGERNDLKNELIIKCKSLVSEGVMDIIEGTLENIMNSFKTYLC